MSTARPPAVVLRDAGLHQGGRWLWSGLDFEVAAGEFVAVLGPNGVGKTSLLRVLLGLTTLSAGSVSVGGRAPHRGSNLVGYVPQQRGFDADLGARGRDLVRLGVDGHRFGFSWNTKVIRDRVDQAIADVGATSYADAPIGRLSGGEQQRLRVAQALLGDPALLLCDEPLLSLDLAHQQGVVELIDARRRVADTAVVFVTHEINPILPFVDRILYLASGRWTAGAVDDVMTSERLSDLYGVAVDVLRVRDRIIVVGGAESSAAGPDHHHHHDHDHDDHRGDREPVR